jgi:hypothetical protein
VVRYKINLDSIIKKYIFRFLIPLTKFYLNRNLAQSSHEKSNSNPSEKALAYFGPNALVTHVARW